MRRCVERACYRTCYGLACLSGMGAAALARAFRALGSHSSEYGPVVIVAQLPLLALWSAARAVFLVSAAPCFALGRRR